MNLIFLENCPHQVFPARGISFRLFFYFFQALLENNCLVIKSDKYSFEICFKEYHVGFTGRCHCVKRARLRSFSGPYFPAFVLNTERCGFSVRSQENTNQKNSEYGQCSWSVHKIDSTKWTIMNYHLPNLKWAQSEQVIPKYYAILMCYKEVHIECRFVPTHVLLCLETCCLTVRKKRFFFSNLYVKSLVSQNLTISSGRSCMHILTVLKN